MIIQVNPHRIVLNKTNEVNSGEYNVNECTFEFSQEYEGLTKVAVFSLCDGTTKNVTILNNQCIIPVECLQETGQVQIGVYGYATENGNLVLRYSPTPQNFVVRLGSYKEGTEPVAPTPTDWEILVEQVSDIAEDVSSIHEDITGINTEISGINTDIRDLQDTKANISDLAEVAFTGEFSDLKNIPSYATTQQLNQEIQDRQDADVNLQSQIDAISVSSDVVDVVGTYQELLNYDTQHLKDNDIVKVLQDSTHSNALSYYRWDKETSTWSYVGSEGPFYTKSETDALLNDKQDVIDIDNMLSSDLVDDTNSTNKFVTQADINNWNNKEDKSNKVTEINSSSTDTQYPSAKCVYDSQEEQNEQIAELEMLYNAFPTVSDEDTTIELNNTAKVKFREIDLKGNTSQVVIPEEQGTSVSNTSIYVSDVNTDKESSIEMSGNTYQATTILPSEYTQVDYIESSGTQYIDTGINADYKLSIKFEFSNLSTSTFLYQGAIVGNNSTNRIRHHFQLTGTSNVTYWAGLHDSGCNTIIISGSVYDNNKKYSLFADIYNQKYYLDNVEISGNFNSNDFDTGINYYLFGRNNNNVVDNMGQMKMYSCQLYYANVLVRDFIPCYRNSDNEVGLYDLVNNVFYTNQGTGDFTYGSVASIPNPDYPQPIEVVTGENTIVISNSDNSQSQSYQINLGNIELCKIDTYQDRIYKRNDKWYLEKKVGKITLNGTEEWGTVQAYSRAWPVVEAPNILVSTSATDLPYLYCNYYNAYKLGDIVNSNPIDYGIGKRSNHSELLVRNKDADTVASLKTWLSTHNTIVYYALATPTTTEITDTTLVNQLNALYNATIYPITNINTDTSNLLPYIDLHYNFVTPSPSPSRPSVVNVVKGNNTITIANSDNTESQNYPINLGDMELCKIGTYQDYIYESNGNWYKKGNIDKLDMSTITAWGGTNNYRFYRTNFVNAYGISIGQVYSNVFLYDSTSWAGTYKFGISNTGSLWLQLPTTSEETKDTIANYLGTINAIMYGILTTPTDTQITDTTLIAQLNNIKKAYSYDTQTNISQTNEDKPFIIYAEAIRSLKDVFE